jgi:hypothetical protein
VSVAGRFPHTDREPVHRLRDGGMRGAVNFSMGVLRETHWRQLGNADAISGCRCGSKEQLIESRRCNAGIRLNVGGTAGICPFSSHI